MLLLNGKYDEAIKQYTMAISINSNDSHAYHDRGVAHMSLGSLDQAIEDIRQAISLEPTAQNYSILATAYCKNKQFAEAAETCTRALSNAPRDLQVEILRTRANAYMEMGEFEPALDDLNQALTLNIRNPITFRDRSELFVRTNQYEAALADIRMALSFSRNDPEIRLREVDVLLRLQHTTLACERLEQLLQIEPESPEARFLAGQIFLQSGSYTEAIESLSMVSVLVPEHKMTHVLLALCWQALGETASVSKELSLANPGAAGDFEKEWQEYQRTYLNPDVLLVIPF